MSSLLTTDHAARPQLSGNRSLKEADPEIFALVEEEKARGSYAPFASIASCGGMMWKGSTLYVELVFTTRCGCWGSVGLPVGMAGMPSIMPGGKRVSTSGVNDWGRRPPRNASWGHC